HAPPRPRARRHDHGRVHPEGDASASHPLGAGGLRSLVGPQLHSGLIYGRTRSPICYETDRMIRTSAAPSLQFSRSPTDVTARVPSRWGTRPGHLISLLGIFSIEACCTTAGRGVLE